MFIIYDAGILGILFCVVAIAGFGSVLSFFRWIAENNTMFILYFLGFITIKALIIAYRGRREAYMTLTTLAGVISSIPLIAFFIYVAHAWFASDYGLFAMLFVILGRVLILCILSLLAFTTDIMIDVGSTEGGSKKPLRSKVRRKKGLEILGCSLLVTAISTGILALYILLCIYW